jgi:hypothetical protein
LCSSFSDDGAARGVAGLCGSRGITGGGSGRDVAGRGRGAAWPPFFISSSIFLRLSSSKQTPDQGAGYERVRRREAGDDTRRATGKSGSVRRATARNFPSLRRESTVRDVAYRANPPPIEDPYRNGRSHSPPIEYHAANRNFIRYTKYDVQYRIADSAVVSLRDHKV